MNNIYLLLGPEKGQKKDFIKLTIKHLYKQNSEKPEVMKIYPFDLESINIEDILFIQSFFTTNKIILFNDFDKIKTKTVKNALLKFFENPNPDYYIFFLSDENNKSKIEKVILNKILPNNIKTFWGLDEKNKKQWVIRFFKEQEIYISPEAINELLDLVEGDTESLRQICNQISIYKGKKSSVTQAEIEDFIFHNKQEDVFSLFNKIVQLDLESSIEIARSINQGNIISLVNGLVWQFKILFKIKSGLLNQLSLIQACEAANQKWPKQIALYEKANNNFTFNDVKNILVYLTKVDSIIKQEKSELLKVSADLIIYKIITKSFF